MDNSHLAGFEIPNKLSDRTNNIIIVKEGGLNSVYGCDSLPLCKQALFFNNDVNPPNQYKNYYSDLDSMFYDTGSGTVPSGAVSGTPEKVLMSVQSLFTCGLIGSKVHKRSTYLGSLLHCGTAIDKSKSYQLYFLKQLEATINMLNLPLNHADYGMVNYIHETVKSRSYLYETSDSKDFEVLLVPRVSLDFLMTSNTFSGSIPNLSKKITDISNKIEALTQNSNQVIAGFKAAIEAAKMQGNAIKTINGNLNQIQRDVINNQVSFMKLVKSNSQTSYDNTVFAIGIADTEFKLSTSKFASIESDVVEHKFNIKELKEEIRDLWKKEAIKEIGFRSADLALDLASFALNAAAAGIGFFSPTPSDGLGAAAAACKDMKDIIASTRALIDSVNVLKNDPYYDLRTSFDEYIVSMNMSSKAINDYKDGLTLDLSAFSMPISKVDILGSEMTSYIKGSSFCDGTFPNLEELCQSMFHEIDSMVRLLREKNENIHKQLDAAMKLNLLNYEKEQYEKNIKNWNDGIQGVADSSTSTCKICDTYDPSKPIEELLDKIKADFQETLSKLMIHSLLIVGNAINGIRTICRASVYRYPEYLSKSNPTWNKYCSDTLEVTDLVSVQEALAGLTAFLEDKWLLYETNSQILRMSMEVTDLLPLDVYKNENDSYPIFITPEMYEAYSDDIFMSRYENVELVFAFFYATDGNGKMILPASLNSQFHNSIILGAPYIKEYGGKKYFYDIEKAAKTEYITQISQSSTSDNLKGDRVFGLRNPDGAFAYETPYCRFQISIDKDIVLTHQSRFFIQFFYISKESSIQPTNQKTPFPTYTPTAKTPTTKSLTNKPTSSPQKGTINMPTKKPTKNPTNKPTKKPTGNPTFKPTIKPTVPTMNPTKRPTNLPTSPTTSICFSLVGKKACKKVKTCIFSGGVCIPK